MPETAEHAISTKLTRKFHLTPFVVFGASVAITLLAIFALSSWAEAGGINHAVQHVLIFVGGAGAGASLITSRKTRKEK